MQTNETITLYAAGILAAQVAAASAVQEDDGGTCNFDSPVVDLTGWGIADIRKLMKELGDNQHLLGDKMSGRYWKGCRIIRVTLQGQGNCRTKMAHAAYKIMQEAGLNARMYCQAD